MGIGNKVGFVARTAMFAMDYKTRGTRRPLNVSLTLTSRCNLKCHYCYSDSNVREGDAYSVDELKGIIDEFVELGTQIFMLQGGEPLVYKGIGEIIEHIKGRDRYCSMNTNGILIDKRIDAIGKLDKVVISLDGKKSVNDAHRGEGVYDRVMDNVELLKERQIPFMFHTVLCKESTVENAVLPMARLAQRHETVISMCNATETGTQINTTQADHIPALEHYRHLAREILRLKGEGYPISNSDYFWQHAIDWPLGMTDIATPEMLPKEFDYIPCVAGRLTAWLDSGGRMFPCPAGFFRPGYMASIYEDGGVRGAWEKLGSLTCVDCLSIGESTPLFSFRLDQLRSAASYLRSKE